MSCPLWFHEILQAKILEWVDSLLQGIFPTQGLNLGLPHSRKIIYQLSHKETTEILEWVAYPFSRGSSSPRNQTRVFCIAGRFFTNWATREVLMPLKPPFNMNTEDIKKWNVATWESIPSQQGYKKKKSQILPCGYLGYQTVLCFCVCLFVLFCFFFFFFGCSVWNARSQFLDPGIEPLPPAVEMDWLTTDLTTDNSKEFAEQDWLYVAFNVVQILRLPTSMCSFHGHISKIFYHFLLCKFQKWYQC